MKNYLLLVITCILFSCGNPGVELPPEDNPIIDTNDIENESILKSKILWKSPFGDSTRISTGSWPMLTSGLVIFNESYGGPNESDILHAFNKNSGELKWTFSSPLLDYRNDILSGMHVRNNNIFLANQKSVYSLTSEGDLRWHKEVGGRGGNITGNLIGNYYYYNKVYGSRTCSDSAALIRFDISDGIEETVLVLHRENDYCPNTYGASLWVNEIGDSILILQNRQFNSRTSSGKVNLLAYNLSNDSIVWEIDSITPSGTSCVAVPPQVKNDYIYFQGGISVFKVDPKNGNIIWDFRVTKSGEGGFFESNLIIEDGLVIANPISEKIFALSDHSGQVVWEKGEFGEHSTENSFASPLNMVYHNGYFYFGTGWYLVCMRLEDGEVVWYEKSPFDHPNQNNLFNGTGLALDQESEILFASDQFWIMAIELFNE